MHWKGKERKKKEAGLSFFLPSFLPFFLPRSLCPPHRKRRLFQGNLEAWRLLQLPLSLSVHKKRDYSFSVVCALSCLSPSSPPRPLERGSLSLSRLRQLLICLHAIS